MGNEQDDYRDLRQELEGLGLFKPRRQHYFLTLFWIAAFTAAGLWFLLGMTSIWAHLFAGVLLATAATQVAFICHDLGHNQLFHSRKVNEFIGVFLANVVTGLSFKAWVKKHSMHHTHTNEIDVDPDLEIPTIAFSAEQARAASAWAKPFIALQHILFFPMLTLALQSVRMSGIAELVEKLDGRRALEIALIGVHVVLLTWAIVSAVGWAHGLGVLAVHQGFSGLYLGLSFATNHKAMPLLEDGKMHNFVYRQLITTRNLKANLFVEWLFGGLGSQIEHHLFPTMPRHNLHLARATVSRFCKERGLPYYETGFYRGFAEIISHLREVAQSLRVGRSSAVIPKVEDQIPEQAVPRTE